MSATAETLPTVTDEINRKTVEAMEWLVHARDQHKITGAEFDTAIQAIWIAVSGLVDKDVTGFLSEAESQASGGIVKRQFFVMDGTLMNIDRHYKPVKVVVRRGSTKTGKWFEEREINFDDKLSPSMSARHYAKVLTKSLQDRGYREL